MDLKIAMSVDFLIYNVKSELAYYFSFAIFKLKGHCHCRPNGSVKDIII